MKKILITGSEGFLAKNFINNVKEKIKFYKFDKKINGDLAKKKKFPEVDYVLHLAAFNSTKDFYNNPLKVIYDNFFPTYNLINYYKNQKKKPIFIFTGTPEIASGAVDLFGYKVPTDEKVPSVIPDILNKRWSYAGSKSLSEQLVIHSGLKFIIVRPHNVYGQFQKNHFIPEFINRSYKNKIELYGWKNKRSWLHVDDFCEALKMVIQSKKCVNQIINIGSNFEMSTLNVAKLILQYKYPNKSKKIIKKNAPQGSALIRIPDIRKIKKLTGWEPKIKVKEGIKKLIEYGK